MQARLILTDRINKRLFSLERSGAISDFGTKIDFAFSVGLLKENVFDDMHLIRRIRNYFAHKKEPLNFETAQIAEWCNTLSSKGDLVKPRHQYLTTFNRLAAFLITLKNVEGLRLARVGESEEIRAKFDEVLTKISEFDVSTSEGK